MHDLLVFTGRGQRFEERQVVVTQAAGGGRSPRGGNTAERSRNTENPKGQDGRGHAERESITDRWTATKRAKCFSDVIVCNESEALAARQSSQYKRSGVGGRLIITLAVNI